MGKYIFKTLKRLNCKISLPERIQRPCWSLHLLGGDSIGKSLVQLQKAPTWSVPHHRPFPRVVPYNWPLPHVVPHHWPFPRVVPGRGPLCCVSHSPVSFQGVKLALLLFSCYLVKDGNGVSKMPKMIKKTISRYCPFKRYGQIKKVRVTTSFQYVGLELNRVVTCGH